MVAQRIKMTPAQMAEASFMAVITAVLGILGIMLPALSFVAYLIVGVPIVVVVVRHNFRVGIMCAIVAAFLIGLLAGPIQMFIFFLQFMILSLVYGYLFGKKKTAGRILLTGTFITIITTVIVFALSIFVSGLGLSYQEAEMEAALQRTVEMYENWGVFDSAEEQGFTREQFMQLVREMMQFLLRLIPAMLFLSSVFTAVTHFMVSRLVLKRLGHKIPDFRPFREWQLPWQTVWGLIAGWVFYLAGDYLGEQGLRTIGQNVMIAYASVLLIFGVSIIAFYFHHYKMSLFSRGLIIILFFWFMQSAILALVFLAMFDIVIDIRKLRNREDKNAKKSRRIEQEVNQNQEKNQDDSEEKSVKQNTAESNSEPEQSKVELDKDNNKEE